jgi:hypothetical protein
MRFFLGIVVGILLTVGGAYLFDSFNSPNSAEATGSVTSSIDRPMVNWDVVDKNWTALTGQVRRGWHKLASNS